MSLYVTADQATTAKHALGEDLADKYKMPEGALLGMDTYFVRAKSGPHAYLVDMPAPAETRAHFHDIDQYQLFLPGGGAWYQRHDIEVLMLHYTDAYSLYGPFGSHGPEPSRFFTLRPAPSYLTGYLPEDRDRLTRRGRRNYKVDVQLQGPLEAGEVRSREVIAPEADGLAAYLVSTGPGATFTPPESHQSSPGQYACVVRGAVEAPEPVGIWSLAWTDGDQAREPHRAGEEGAEVLFMHFPAPTSAESN